MHSRSILYTNKRWKRDGKDAFVKEFVPFNRTISVSHDDFTDVLFVKDNSCLKVRKKKEMKSDTQINHPW